MSQLPAPRFQKDQALTTFGLDFAVRNDCVDCNYQPYCPQKAQIMAWWSRRTCKLFNSATVPFVRHYLIYLVLPGSA